jgi:hypothetical protein
MIRVPMLGTRNLLLVWHFGLLLCANTRTPGCCNCLFAYRLWITISLLSSNNIRADFWILGADLHLKLVHKVLTFGLAKVHIICIASCCINYFEGLCDILIHIWKYYSTYAQSRHTLNLRKVVKSCQ